MLTGPKNKKEISNDIEFINGIHVKFKDDFFPGDFAKSKIIFTQYFENGRAVYIQLDEKQVAFLIRKMQELGVKASIE